LQDPRTALFGRVHKVPPFPRQILAGECPRSPPRQISTSFCAHAGQPEQKKPVYMSKGEQFAWEQQNA
jgi:hypothetical protein